MFAVCNRWPQVMFGDLMWSFCVKDLFSLSSHNGIELVILSHLQAHPFLLGVLWLILKMLQHQDALCQLMEAVRSNTADAADLAKQRKAVASLLLQGG